MSISDADKDQLIEAARQVRTQAYAPYSRFLVGAALLDAAGNIHTGVNVENASYGLTMCAERTAIGTMVAAGQKKVVAAAVSSDNGVTPCGACRQVLLEFAADIPIWLISMESGEIRQTSLHTLIPDHFDQSKLTHL